ncbi:hypothetical protein FQZ97_838460 [compost metagenome]
MLEIREASAFLLDRCLQLGANGCYGLEEFLFGLLVGRKALRVGSVCWVLAVKALAELYELFSNRDTEVVLQGSRRWILTEHFAEVQQFVEPVAFKGGVARDGLVQRFLGRFQLLLRRIQVWFEQGLCRFEVADQVVLLPLPLVLVVRRDIGDVALVLHQLAVPVIGDDFPIDAVADLSIAESLIDGELLVHLQAGVLDGVDGIIATSECNGQQRDKHDLSQAHSDLELWGMK